MSKRVKKKETELFFDSFKHFKNNFSNLICLELPKLVNSKDADEYLKLKSVNYKSKYPDMKKIGLIDYKKPSDNEFSLSEEGKIIYDIIKTKNNLFEYKMSDDVRLESINPTKLWKSLNNKERKIIEKQLVKLLISYYDTADCIRPYLSLIKTIEKLDIKKLDDDTLCNILAQKKSDILLKTIDKKAYEKLDSATKIELKRPISYMINGLETAGIIDSNGNVVYDKDSIKDIIFDLNEVYLRAEGDIESGKKTTRSSKEQTDFRNAVLKAYGYKCAITGESIQIKNEKNKKTYLLDAAHIIPYSDSGSFAVTNGIALSPHMHRIFDKRLFAFKYNEDGTLEIVVTKSAKVKDVTGVLTSLDKKRVYLPKKQEYHPNTSAIMYRKKKYLL